MNLLFITQKAECYVLHQNDQFIGTIGLSTDDLVSLYPQYDNWIESVYIDKKYRGKGLQKRLIDVRTRAAKRHFCYTVITYTTPDNYASANNLIRRGFKMYDPEYQYGGSTMLYFIKDVDYQ